MIEECLVVEFRVDGDDCPLSEAASETGVQIDCQPPQVRQDGNTLLRFGARADEALVDALDADDRIRYLHVSRSDGRHNFRCLSKDACVVNELVDAGFLVESIQYRDGVETYTGAVVGHNVLKGVLDRAGETVGVTLERVYPLGAEDEEPLARQWDVTRRQEEALVAAHRLGYFTVPREVTAAAVADELDISKSAFLERLHRGERALFDQLL